MLVDEAAKAREGPLDEEDDFEEFDEGEQPREAEEELDAKVEWHGDWGEEEVNHQFCEQLRAELEKHKARNT